jgi:site-specific recombinase XerD
MSKTKRQRRFRNDEKTPYDHTMKPFKEWSHENRNCAGMFRDWLLDTGYSTTAVKCYGAAARQVLAFLDKLYWTIDPDADLELVWQHMQTRSFKPLTLEYYHAGLKKFAEYLRLRCHKPAQPPHVNWDHYIGPLPGWLQQDVKSFIQHCKRTWKDSQRAQRIADAVSHLTQPLRWMAEHFTFESLADLTPQVWYAYLDYRLENGVSPNTTNAELSTLKHLVHYLKEHDRLICERFLLVEYQERIRHAPKDVPVGILRQLQQAIQVEAMSMQVSSRRMGRMDLAWFILMLHTGLRTGEVRDLQLGDIDWERRRLHIRQTKGLKDRLVFLSQAGVEALRGYLAVRGPAEALPGQVFIYHRHKPLSSSYCEQRLKTYCKRLGIHITPHQLRHSCASMLLNAGVPVLSVQMLLGHTRVDTTLGYARLYDGTVAADYYQALAFVERQMALPEDRLVPPPGIGQLVALVDSLRDGTLNAVQVETVRQLRAGILALAERQDVIQDVKVLNSSP